MCVKNNTVIENKLLSETLIGGRFNEFDFKLELFSCFSIVCFIKLFSMSTNLTVLGALRCLC